MSKTLTNRVSVKKRTGAISDTGLAGREATALELVHNVLKLLTKDPDAESATDEYSMSPLQRAILRGIGQGRRPRTFRIDVTVPDNVEPAFATTFRVEVASPDGGLFTETAEQLLARGANPNGNGHSLGTPLECAAFYGALDAIELLVRRGADVNLAGFDGTPLKVAVDQGHRDAALLLCRLGANKDEWPGGIKDDEVARFLSARKDGRGPKVVRMKPAPRLQLNTVRDFLDDVPMFRRPSLTREAFRRMRTSTD